MPPCRPRPSPRPTHFRPMRPRRSAAAGSLAPACGGAGGGADGRRAGAPTRLPPRRPLPARPRHLLRRRPRRHPRWPSHRQVPARRSAPAGAPGGAGAGESCAAAGSAGRQPCRLRRRRPARHRCRPLRLPSRAADRCRAGGHGPLRAAGRAGGGGVVAAVARCRPMAAMPGRRRSASRRCRRALQRRAPVPPLRSRPGRRMGCRWCSGSVPRKNYADSTARQKSREARAQRSGCNRLTPWP